MTFKSLMTPLQIRNQRENKKLELTAGEKRWEISYKLANKRDRKNEKSINDKELKAIQEKRVSMLWLRHGSRTEAHASDPLPDFNLAKAKDTLCQSREHHSPGSLHSEVIYIKHAIMRGILEIAVQAYDDSSSNIGPITVSTRRDKGGGFADLMDAYYPPKETSLSEVPSNAKREDSKIAWHNCFASPSLFKYDGVDDLCEFDDEIGIQISFHKPVTEVTKLSIIPRLDGEYYVEQDPVIDDSIPKLIRGLIENHLNKPGASEQP